MPIIIGDSHARNFSRIFFKHDQELTLTFGGACIADIKNKVKQHKEIFQNCGQVEVIIIVGTNDFLNGKLFGQVKNEFKSLIKLLRNLNSQLRLVPVEIFLSPKVLVREQVTCQIISFNKFLSTLCSSKLIVVTINNHLLECPNKFFQQFYRTGRPDLLHLSYRGNSLLYTVIAHVLQSK